MRWSRTAAASETKGRSRGRAKKRQRKPKHATQQQMQSRQAAARDPGAANHLPSPLNLPSPCLPDPKQTSHRQRQKLLKLSRSSCLRGRISMMHPRRLWCEAGCRKVRHAGWMSTGPGGLWGFTTGSKRQTSVTFVPTPIQTLDHVPASTWWQQHSKQPRWWQLVLSLFGCTIKQHAYHIIWNDGSCLLYIPCKSISMWMHVVVEQQTRKSKEKLKTGGVMFSSDATTIRRNIETICIYTVKLKLAHHTFLRNLFAAQLRRSLWLRMTRTTLRSKRTLSWWKGQIRSRTRSLMLWTCLPLNWRSDEKMESWIMSDPCAT